MFDFSLYTAGLPLMGITTIIALIGGTLTGIVIGALPGLSAMMAVSILVPLTYGMTAEVAILMLLGVYCGANYGGSIAATLVNIPGTPSAVMTTLDAYPMAKNGQAGLAIGLATMSSAIGGFFSVIVLSMLSPLIARFALQFTSLEKLSIAIFGISVMAFISKGSTVKGLMAGIFGLMVASMGFDPNTSILRFNFGSIYLNSGVNFTAAMIGLFGMTEIMLSAEKKAKSVPDKQIEAVKNPFACFKYLRLSLGNLFRSSVIGVIVGAIPGAGGTIASIISYAQQKKLSKHPEKMGQGAVEGIVAAEAANNACTGGAMTTLLSLGIPGDAVTGILMGAFIIHGLQPGPNLFNTNYNLISAIFIGMFLINILILVLGLLGAPYFAKLLKFPRQLLNTVILVLCVVGTFGVQNSMFDVRVMVVFAIIGYIFTKLEVPRAPIVLALILGSMMEENLRRWLSLADGQYWAYFMECSRKTPIAPIILAITIFTLISPLFKKTKVFSEDALDEYEEINKKNS
ncbi:MAG TPA: C4-dicarboxylate ABC transporter permease [Sphaerochaeta sp.]|jgi:putative tricarboxylic transport membrane protein|nr:MAG: C4-dicarboxylate ABC transporter permease [Spirochaetae bacterium HGW-Spirochaetae-8]PKL20189.1 MAG: C4-dicarboxylate ABC transporter permease [Spirochaetae bacterium HGW-Spirochaetae-4]HCG64456.1 C4-dicarboxylate ABC transporter permease [Sphaerochaeta sp.]HCJ94399.1 C4-dicarboxylate ABC transporter permease [Sphaerochaeta sp.]HCS37865.1 C4-dicarboxylate ABC transporter permease [Sphaerochaeta sp.]